MKHQPFEDWILFGERLDAAAEAALDAHLRDCAACRDLRDDLGRVDAVLRGAASARPEAGFRLRWAEHQARDAGRRGREREWRLLAAAAAAVLGLVALLLGIYLLAGGSAALLLAAGLQQVVRWALWLRVVGEIGRAIAWNLPLLSVSGYALFLTALITATGLMIVTWSTTIRRYSPKGVRQ